MGWTNYGQETRPNGKWVRTVEFCSVLGIEENLAAFWEFAATVDHAQRKKLRYGVDIELDPTNVLTPHALAVIGVAQSKPLFGKLISKQWFLGHVWNEIADELHEDLVSRGVPIAAELLSINRDRSAPQVKIAILAPPGHSKSKRESARSRRRLLAGGFNSKSDSQ